LLYFCISLILTMASGMLAIAFVFGESVSASPWCGSWRNQAGTSLLFDPDCRSGRYGGSQIEHVESNDKYWWGKLHDDGGPFWMLCSLHGNTRSIMCSRRSGHAQGHDHHGDYVDSLIRDAVAQPPFRAPNGTRISSPALERPPILAAPGSGYSPQPLASAGDAWKGVWTGTHFNKGPDDGYPATFVWYGASGKYQDSFYTNKMTMISLDDNYLLAEKKDDDGYPYWFHCAMESSNRGRCRFRSGRNRRRSTAGDYYLQVSKTGQEIWA